MEEMQQHNMSWIEVQFLKKAVDILCECRRTLMYTYVFAYYLRKNNQSEIFEVRISIIVSFILVFDLLKPKNKSCFVSKPHIMLLHCRKIKKTWKLQQKHYQNI